MWIFYFDNAQNYSEHINRVTHSITELMFGLKTSTCCVAKLVDRGRRSLGRLVNLVCVHLVGYELWPKSLGCTGWVKSLMQTTKNLPKDHLRLTERLPHIYRMNVYRYNIGGLNMLNPPPPSLATSEEVPILGTVLPFACFLLWNYLNKKLYTL